MHEKKKKLKIYKFQCIPIHPEIFYFYSFPPKYTFLFSSTIIAIGIIKKTLCIGLYTDNV